MGVQFGFLFGGTLLVEVIYSYPGLGNLMVDAVRNADLPIIQAVGLTYCVVVLLINTVVDASTSCSIRSCGCADGRRCPRSLRSGRVLIGARHRRRASRCCALFAPLLAPHDPGEQNLLAILLPPAWSAGGDAAFPLGTDSLGRACSRA